MRPIEIDLSKPFKQVLASLLTLPGTHAETDELHFSDSSDSVLRKSAAYDVEVKEALRSLYEAAHGRQVETQIGFVSIAPPVGGFLKETPYYVATRYEFFLEAFTRILTGDSPRKGRTSGSRKPDSKCGTNRHRMDASRSYTRENRNTFPPHASARVSNNQQTTRL